MFCEGLTPEFDGQVVFLHGLESGPKGRKAEALIDAFGAEVPDFTGMDFDTRMTKMSEVYEKRTSLILVGSSMGARLAMEWACQFPQKVKAMLLIAPAFGVKLGGIPKDWKIPSIKTLVLAGLHDDLIEPSLILGSYPDAILCDDDHRMSKPETIRKIVEGTWAISRS